MQNNLIFNIVCGCLKALLLLFLNCTLNFELLQVGKKLDLPSSFERKSIWTLGDYHHSSIIDGWQSDRGMNK